MYKILKINTESFFFCNCEVVRFDGLGPCDVFLGRALSQAVFSCDPSSFSF